MSTVAYSGGVWAYDTRVSGGDYVDRAVDKAFQTNVPTLSVGVVGDLKALTRLRYADFPMPNDEESPEKYAYAKVGPFLAEILEGSDAEVMFAFDGLLFGSESTGGVYAIPRGYHAIGSGGAYAMTALHVNRGTHPRDAVRVASEFDVYTSNVTDGFEDE